MAEQLSLDTHDEPEAPKGTDLKAIAKQVDRLHKALAQVVKSNPAHLDECIKALKDAVDAAQRVSSDELLQELRRTLDAKSKQMDAALQKRRETFHKLAGGDVRHVDRYDRYRVLKVEYDGPKVELFLGKERLYSEWVLDGEKLFDACRREIEHLEAGPFNRTDFIQDLAAASQMLQAWYQVPGPAPDFAREGYVRVRDLPDFLNFARTRRKPGKAAPMSLAQLTYDLGRFMKDGVEERSLRLELRSPAAGKDKEAVEVPVLDQPTALGKSIRLLRIVKA